MVLTVLFLVTSLFYHSVFFIFISEFLVLDSVVPPEEGNEVLLSLLQKSPQSSTVRPRNGGNSMRKFKKVSEQVTRPGYSSDSQFACRHCGKRYRWKSTMRRHEQVECGGKEPKYRCPICPYRAKQKGNLGVHVRKHHFSSSSWKLIAFSDLALFVEF